MRKILFTAVIASFVTTALAEPKIKLTQIYKNQKFERPLALVVPDDGTNRRFLAEQTGKIKILPADENSSDSKLFADFSEGTMTVEKDFEEGLLGLAFHPDFKSNSKVYVSYSAQGPKRLIISEFAAKGDTLDMESERVLVSVQQPEWNHNSGNIVFGKDGFLYIAVGDGGFRDGIHMLAQRLQAWNGKVLRIDVNSKSDGREYGIPSDNPFIEDPAASPEIFAYGLRNPWGISVDHETGLFWLADVGQDLHEEVNIIEKGGNYGWNYFEGVGQFARRGEILASMGRDNKIPRQQFVEPIQTYSRDKGLSITGGFVYRGEKVPSLKGHYVYGDWKFGNLWALEYDAESKKVVANHHIEEPSDFKDPTVQPTGFYPDENGEVIALGWRGKIFRMEAAE